MYDHCMDCMISYNCMALLWKPCFQVWPFYGNHVFKYDRFMETMFSSMVILWIPCFLSMALLWKSCFLKYGTLMKPALLLLSSQNTSHIRTHHYFWKWHLLLEAQHDLNTTTDQKHEFEYFLKKTQIKRNRKKSRKRK